MWYFKRAFLHNVVFYKDAELDLDYVGLTVIKGWNKNASRKGRMITNGAGKSLLLSVLPNICLNSNPVLSMGSRSSGVKKALLTEKDSYYGLDFESQQSGDKSTAFTFAKRSTGKDFKYELAKNGKDLKVRTKPLAEEYIGEVFPLTEEQFYSYIYLDGRRPFPLQMGTAADRMKFFTELFPQLTEFDHIREEARAYKTTLRDYEVEFKEVRVQRADLMNQIEGLDEKKLLALSKTVNSKTKKLRHKSEELHHRQLELNTLSQAVRLQKTLRVELKKYGLKSSLVEVESVENVVSAVVSELKTAERELAALRDYRSYLSDLSSYKSKRKTLRSKLKDNRTTQELKDTIRSVSKLERKYHPRLIKAEQQVRTTERELRGLQGNYKASEGDKSRLSKLRKKHGKDLQDSLAKTIDDLQSKIQAQSKIEKLAGQMDHDQGRCFVCRSKIDDRKGHDQIIASLKEHRKHLESRASKLDKLLRWVKKIEAGLEISERKNTLEAQRDKYATRVKAVRKKLKNLPDVNSLQNALAIKARLRDLRKPDWAGDKPTGDSKLLKKRVRGLQSIRSDLRVYLPMVEKLGEIKVDGSIEQMVTDTKRQYRRIEKRLTKLVHKSGSIQPKLDLLRKTKKKLADLDDRLTKLERRAKDAPVTDMLLNVYSVKGLKNLAIKRLSEDMERKFNRYAPLIFPEPFKFKFEVGPNQFDILVDRNAGKSKISDVKFLSGAESSQFNLLMLPSILPMIPHTRRSNIVVLDELDGRMNEAARELFIHQLIPLLNTLIPHVIVVTPLNEEYPGSRVLTAVKDGDVTTLIRREHH